MMNIYICNTYQYLYFCRKFTEMDKGKIKPKQHLEFASSADNKSYKKIFLNVKSCDIQQPIRHFKLFANWYITFHWQISRKKSTVFNHYKMNICDQLRLKSFDIRDAHGKFSKKIWIQSYQFWNLYCNTAECFVRPKICKIFKFSMDKHLQIATKEKFCEENFCEHQNFICFNFTNQL